MVQSRAVTETGTFLAELEIAINASPETVFEFFTDPAKMTQWKGDEAELDPQPGGIYRVRVLPTSIACGSYVRIDPPTFVSFTFGWEGNDQPVPPGASLVEVTLTPEGAGTVVRLRHTKLPSEDAVHAHTQGWDHFLHRLAVAAAGGDAGPDPWREEGPS